jgi:hypothetical protein
MNEYMSTITEAQDRVLDTVKQIENVVVSGVATAAESIGSYIPGTLPKMTWISRFPAPADMVNAYFSFAEGVMESNRHYALALLDAVRPVTTKILPASMTHKAVAATRPASQPSTVTASKPATATKRPASKRPAAKRSTTKRATAKRLTAVKSA